MCSFAETTHTPQGDGNCTINANRQLILKQPTPRKGTETRPTNPPAWKRGNNPHPARGRKQQDHAGGRGREETTHTPQGDGNRWSLNQSRTDFETTHTPQGDGNGLIFMRNQLQLKQPTPRKGTETESPASRSTLPLETTHTPQGDGNPHPLTHSVYLRETAHTPQGDGNGA